MFASTAYGYATIAIAARDIEEIEIDSIFDEELWEATMADEANN